MCFRTSRCEGRIECTSSAFTRRRSCGYEFNVVECAVKTMRRVLLRARARAPEMMFAKKKSSPSNPSPDEKSSSRLCKTTNARKNRKTRLEKSDHKTTTRRTFSTLKDDAFTGTFATTLFVCEFCIRIVGATTFAEAATAYIMMMFLLMCM